MDRLHLKKIGLACLAAVVLTAAVPLYGPLNPSVSAAAAKEQPLKLELEIILKQGSNKAVVNGKEMTVEFVYEVNGITMFPINTLIRAFNLDIKFHGQNSGFTLTNKSYHSYEALVVFGQKSVEINGQSRELPVPVVKKSNSIMVPLRAFAETLGASVHYNSQTKTIRITKEAESPIDGKQRLGSSKDNWSIAAPKLWNSQPAEYDGVWTWSGWPYKDANSSFYVSVKAEEGGEPFTDEEAWKHLGDRLHPSMTVIDKRIFKGEAGSFTGLIATQNDAFSISYNQYWMLRLPEKTYYIEIVQGNTGLAAERDWVTNPVLGSFRASFDKNDKNLTDVLSLLQEQEQVAPKEPQS